MVSLILIFNHVLKDGVTAEIWIWICPKPFLCSLQPYCASSSHSHILLLLNCIPLFFRAHLHLSKLCLPVGVQSVCYGWSTGPFCLCCCWSMSQLRNIDHSYNIQRARLSCHCLRFSCFILCSFILSWFSCSQSTPLLLPALFCLTCQPIKIQAVSYVIGFQRVRILEDCTAVHLVWVKIHLHSLYKQKVSHWHGHLWDNNPTLSVNSRQTKIKTYTLYLAASLFVLQLSKIWI